MKRFSFIQTLGILVTALYVFYFSSVTLAAEKNTNFVHVKNTLSANLGLRTIRSALLDDSGQMWIGTQSGLFLFNGSNANGYSDKKTAPSPVWQSDVASIKNDSYGNVWVLTSNDGLFGFDENATELNPHNYTHSLRDAYSLEITKTHMWVVDGTGLHLIDLIFGLPASSSPMLNILPSRSRLTNILKTESGVMCVGATREIICWDGDSLNTTNYKIFPELPANLRSHALTALSATGSGSEILAGTSNGEVYEVSLDDRISQIKCRVETETSAKITSIAHSATGVIIGTDNGVFQLSENGGKCPSLGIRELRNSHVTNSYNFEDHLWVATYTGIHTIKNSPFVHISTANSQIDNEVMSFELIPEYGLFVGTYNGLFFRQENSNEFIEVNLPSVISQETNKRVMALKYDGVRLWIGLREGGILWYDVSKQSFFAAPKAFRDFSITTISRQSNSFIYVGTYGNGLWAFSENQNITNVARVDLPNEFSNITVIEPVDDAVFFISSEFTSAIFCVEQYAWLPCAGYVDIPLTHKSRVLSAKSLSSGKEIFIGTQNSGLYRFDLGSTNKWNGEKVDLLTHDKESIFSILKADDFSLWLATSYGLVRYAPPEDRLDFYFAQDGLQDNDFNYGASLSSQTGDLYFGGSNGFNFFRPDELAMKRSPPKLYFRDVQIGSAHQTQRSNTSKQFDVELDHADYFFRVFYHLPDFIDSSRIKYRYKLHPFDPDYIDGGSDGSATYTNIPPGDYVFHVQGANSAGVWNTAGITMNIRVLPPLWRTWWAYCLYLVGFAVTMFVVKKWYDTNVLRIQADEIARERTIAAHTALDDMQEQLEAQDSLVRNIRQRNIANFDTVANIIEHRSDYLPDDISAEIMRGSSRHVHALALLERSLKYYNDSLFADLHAFTADCLSDLSVKNEYPHGVTTINEVSPELVSAEDATLVGIIIHELLSNAFQHAFHDNEKSRYIRIATTYSQTSPGGPTSMSLKVQDSGSGIPQGIVGEQPGLSLVRQIVNHFGGRMEIDSNNGTAISVFLELSAATK